MTYFALPSTSLIFLRIYVSVNPNPILHAAGSETHRGGHQPAHHVQRVPAHGARQGRYAQERPHPPQGGILQGIQQVSPRRYTPEYVEPRTLYCHFY